MNSDELLRLRAEIDALDEKLLSVLAARFEVTTRVGKLKAQNGIAAVDPSREAELERMVRARAGKLDLNPDFAWKVFRLVIDETVENHKRAR